MPKLDYDVMPSPDNPELIAVVAEGFSKGRSLRAIAAKARMARDTLKRWLIEGRRELDVYQAGGMPLLGSYGRFVTLVESSYADFEEQQVEYLDKGKESGGKGWIPALAHLRSVNPEWSETQRVESTVDVSVTHRLELPGVAERALLEIVQAQLLEEQKLLAERVDTTEP